MALNVETRNVINNLSKDILRLYNISIPIHDIDSVVRHMGGSILTDASMDYFSEGKIRKNGEGFEIIISPYQTDERRTFTIAHELGHLFLHMGYKISEEVWNSQDNVQYYRNGRSDAEYQANEFAAAFLMPENEYIRIMDKHTEGNKVYSSEIAKYFNVSTEAASNRGKWLGLLQW